MIDWLQHSTGGLLTLAVVSIAVLLLLIIKFKVEPFIALIVVALLVALLAGVPVETLVGSAQKASDSLLEKGFGCILGHIAAIIGLGTLLGAILEASGGAQVLMDKLLNAFGEKTAPVAMGLAGLIFGVPVFFDIGIFVLAPLVYVAAKRSGKSIVLLQHAFAGRPFGHARVPAAAPRTGGGGRSARRGARLDHPDGSRGGIPSWSRRVVSCTRTGSASASTCRCPRRCSRRRRQGPSSPRAASEQGAARRSAWCSRSSPAAGADPRRHVRHHPARPGNAPVLGGDVLRHARGGADDLGAARVLAAGFPARHDPREGRGAVRRLAEAGRDDPARGRRGWLLRRGAGRDGHRQDARRATVRTSACR